MCLDVDIGGVVDPPPHFKIHKEPMKRVSPVEKMIVKQAIPTLQIWPNFEQIVFQQDGVTSCFKSKANSRLSFS